MWGICPCYNSTALYKSINKALYPSFPSASLSERHYFSITGVINVATYQQLTHRVEKNGHNFADDVFKCIFLNANVCILNTIWLNSVLECLIDYITLSEPMVVSLLMHLCVTRPQGFDNSVLCIRKATIRVCTSDVPCRWFCYSSRRVICFMVGCFYYIHYFTARFIF